MGTLRRMVKKPVVVSSRVSAATSVRRGRSGRSSHRSASLCLLQFSIDCIQLETEGRNRRELGRARAFGSEAFRAGLEEAPAPGGLPLVLGLGEGEAGVGRVLRDACGCSSGAELDTLEEVRLQASQLISCEWCSVRKLPVLFFQTTEEECVRLRSQLHMSREDGGQWYDCAGDRKSAGGRRKGPRPWHRLSLAPPAPPRRV